MRALTAIVEDIGGALGLHYLAEIAGAPSEVAAEAAMRHIARAADDDRSLSGWLAENLGLTGVRMVLRELKLPFDASDSVEEAIGRWLQFRGVMDRQASTVALHRVSLLLEESARQAAVDPAKYDVVRLLAEPLQWLLRHVAFYYFDDLWPSTPDGAAGHPASQGGAPNDRQPLDSMSLAMLCRVLDRRESVRGRPYDSASGPAITLGTQMAQASLATIERLTDGRSATAPDDDAAMCGAVCDLIQEWHHRGRIIPKGATVRTYQQTSLKTVARCVDEYGRELRVVGAPTWLAALDNILVAADECEEAWGPHLRALPGATTWASPDILRRTARGMQVASRTGIFISYSHADADDQLRIEIEKGLKALGIKDTVTCWTDVAIECGSDWKREIESALARSKVFVCLLSTDFLASDFIRDVEIPAMVSAQSKGGRILWVLSRSCAWDKSSFASLQAAYPTKKALNQLSRSNRDVALTRICKAIQEACVLADATG